MPNPDELYGNIRGASYCLSETLGLLGSPGEYTKEVTIGTWSDRPFEKKLDIRRWRGNEYKSGISLTEKEVRDLRRILDKIDFGK